MRAVPELIWRTAVTSTTIGAGEHKIRIKPGDVIVAGAVSATQQCLTEGSGEYHHAFGGNRREKDHPTHACPGADPAVALMIGFFSALVETPLPLRPGPGPLTISADGAVLAAPAVRKPVAAPPHFTAAPRSDGTTPILVIGDSWLSDTAPYPSLRGALAARGYIDEFDQDFASLGRFLHEMADPAALDQVARFFDNIGPGEASPACIVLGGGGNDVCQPVSNIPLTALYRMTRDHGGQGGESLIEEEVGKFIDEELYGHLTTVVGRLQEMTDIPIVVHAYDHPIPNGSGFWLGGPWLKPIFDHRFMSDLSTNTAVMKALIDRLNGAAARVAAANPQRARHVKLTSTTGHDPRYGRMQRCGQTNCIPRATATRCWPTRWSRRCRRSASDNPPGRPDVRPQRMATRRSACQSIPIARSCARASSEAEGLAFNAAAAAALSAVSRGEPRRRADRAARFIHRAHIAASPPSRRERSRARG